MNAMAAAAVYARIEADARMVRAKARLWTLLGAGALLALLGVGVGAALVGYQSRVDLVRGKVQLDDGATLKLNASDTSVKLDTTGATVRLDSANNTTLPHAPEARPQSGAKVVTDYVVFRQVDIADGTVETGWRYARSDDPAPEYQFCHLKARPEADGGWRSWTLAEDRKPVAFANPPPFDVANALRNCVWFQDTPWRRF
jgi:hypothetical protein